MCNLCITFMCDLMSLSYECWNLVIYVDVMCVSCDFLLARLLLFKAEPGTCAVSCE